ncbi:hypothetical protein ORI98_02320 [Shewanella sp. ULN5]|uniref:hypothetical protein n=1 Tax=Shewanella sp. ULN5 TaxID=2994678 RepID=UPI00273F286E|nr:hypothetical protein [Shewanella sp. ULN5]MDP5145275.1 hypothetical protein [Shewanella sp. ULN5]
MMDKFTSKIKMGLAIALMSLLYGCGGGDSGDKPVVEPPPVVNPPPVEPPPVEPPPVEPPPVEPPPVEPPPVEPPPIDEPMTISPVTAMVNVNENDSSAPLSFKITDADENLVVRTTATSLGSISHSFSGDNLIVVFNARDVSKFTNVDTVQVTISGDEEQVSVTLNLSVENTSGNALLTGAKQIESVMRDGGIFTELEMVNTIYSKSNRLLSTIDKEKSVAAIEDVAKAIEDAEQVIYDSFVADSIASAVSRYEANQITQSFLSFEVEKALDVADQAALKVVDFVNEMSENSYITPALPNLSFNLYNGQLSAFIGNGSMGEFSDGQWVFLPEFEIIADTLNKSDI